MLKSPPSNLSSLVCHTAPSGSLYYGSCCASGFPLTWVVHELYNQGLLVQVGKDGPIPYRHDSRNSLICLSCIMAIGIYLNMWFLNRLSSNYHYHSNTSLIMYVEYRTIVSFKLLAVMDTRLISGL